MNDDGLAVANLLERISQQIRSDEQVGELNPAQWAALRYLARANRFSRNPIALSRYLGTTRGTTSQTLIALERKGYVSRKPSARDKRSVDLELTKQGRQKLNQDPISLLAEVSEQTLGADSSSARALLSRLLAGLIERNEGRMFGQCRTCRYFRPQQGASKTAPHRCGLLDIDLSDDDSERICVEHELPA